MRNGGEEDTERREDTEGIFDHQETENTEERENHKRSVISEFNPIPKLRILCVLVVPQFSLPPSSSPFAPSQIRRFSNCCLWRAVKWCSTALP
jgi:hypothetical protein